VQAAKAKDKSRPVPTKPVKDSLSRSKGGMAPGSKVADPEEDNLVEVEEANTNIPSGLMTKVQYGKLLIARAKKKLADELRQKSEVDKDFRKNQVDKFLGLQQRKVEDAQVQQKNVTAAVEGFRMKNLEVGIKIRSNIAEWVSGAEKEKMEHAHKARELVEHAKNAQSPRIMESHRAVRQEKEARAARLRAEIEELHRLGAEFHAAEIARKREMLERIQKEISEEALLASVRVITTERLEIVLEVKQQQKEGELKIAKQRADVRADRQAKKAAVTDFKKGAKDSRAKLSSRRKADADDLRGRAKSLMERKTTDALETAQSKRRSRDLILEQRAPDPPTSPKKRSPKLR